MKRIKAALAVPSRPGPFKTASVSGVIAEPAGLLPGPELAERFARRWKGVGGLFHRASDAHGLEDVLREILGTVPDGPVSVAASAEGLAPGLRDILDGLGIKAVSPDPDQAASASAGLTGVHLALAYSGTLVLTSRDPGELSASLLPPVHVALVPQSRLVFGVDQALRILARTPRPRAMTFITGASRTADIELTLVMGVHGPGQAHAVLLAGEEFRGSGF